MGGINHPVVLHVCPSQFVFSWPIFTKFGANILLETVSTLYSFLIHNNQKQEDGRRTKLVRWERFFSVCCCLLLEDLIQYGDHAKIVLYLSVIQRQLMAHWR
jgi:hypothetical protein